ncbi:Molybdopterin biosynthesis MoaE [Sporodiniella umbellata]|nr:Molybdopterin biosynthesis MoaE [Sporodiniella umbellata]
MNKNFVRVTGEPIPNSEEASRLVSDDSIGAISVFVGTTRNFFEGKKVVSLEYEAYVPMAEKVLDQIIAEARSKWDLKHIGVFHRTGSVPVGQTSVVIAVSSTHRKDGLHATEYLIDTLKAKCPIWKKEVYLDGSVWKGACH